MPTAFIALLQAIRLQLPAHATLIDRLIAEVDRERRWTGNIRQLTNDLAAAIRKG